MPKKNTNSSSSNIQSIYNHREREYDTIPFRIDFVKELLKDKELEPIVNFDDLSTDAFIPSNSYKYMDGSKEGDSNDSNYDVRVLLNKKKYDFYKIFNGIGGRLKYIKSGTTGHTFKGMLNQDGNAISYAVKVVAYPKKEKYGDLNDSRRPENAELMMIKLLSYFVLKKQTPHIVLPIGTFYTSINPFLNLIEENVVEKDNKKYNEFIKKNKNGDYYDYVSILISEWANRGDLLDFFRKNYKEFTLLHWKAFFFQIISALAVIQSKYPSFRHNDMKANNVLVHKVSQRGTLFSYTICKKKYMMPNIGYQIKLWDFDFACIPGIVDNSKVEAKWTDDINVKPIQNRYYDLHYFFNTLIKKGFFPEIIEDSCVPREVKEFIHRVVPSKFQKGEFVSERGRILINDEYLLPEKVIENDNFFEDFRNYKPKKK